MYRGKFGMLLPFYAVIGFILAVFNQTVLAFMLLFFVMAAENNIVVSKQVAEAALLSTFYTVVKAILGGISGALVSLFGMIPFMNSGFLTVIGNIFGFLQFALLVVILVFAVLAIVNVLKGKPSNVPVLNKLAAKMFGE